MSMEERIQIRELDVYAVSDKGNEELKRGTTELSHSAREVLVQGEDVMRGLAGGTDGYITKPFDRDVLLTGIRAVLGLR